MNEEVCGFSGAGRWEPRAETSFGCISAPIRTVEFSQLGGFKNTVGVSAVNGGRVTVEVKSCSPLFKGGLLPGFIAYSASF